MYIGSDVTVNASIDRPTIFNAVDNSKIIIGNNCLLSNSIELHTSDYHSIFDDNGNRVNYKKDIVIGNHVWIGLRCLILKGTVVEENCVIGANSVLVKHCKIKNSIIVGSPAKVIRNNITWNISRNPLDNSVSIVNPS